ncbi:MAG: STAS domain-containing protein [Bacteroidales bacterium]
MNTPLQITEETTPDGIRLKIEGRIDGYWAGHLEEQLEKSFRAGHYRIGLDLEGVHYISSMGIRLLIKFNKQFQEVNGRFGLLKSSAEVKTVLDMVGLSTLLNLPSEAAREADSEWKSLLKAQVRFEIKEEKAIAPLECSISGNPEAVFQTPASHSTCSKISFHTGVYGVGLGAIGKDFDDCRDRFGEFMGMGNAVVYQPPGHRLTPDYVIQQGNLIPEINVLYGILFQGEFSHLIHFSPIEGEVSLSMSQLVDTVAEITGFRSFAMVMLAETAGIVGSSLNVSPLSGPSNGSLFTFPAVRENINFTTEPEYSHTMTVTIGVASYEPDPNLKRVTRATSPGGVWQHFHTAIYTYHPLCKADIDLYTALSGFFEHDKIQSILHLISDKRDAVGAGESEFYHGTCWVGKIESVQTVN